MHCQKPHKHGQIPVHLLQVSRQIYHEAALKPFTQPIFDLDTFTLSYTSSLAQLVPVQARAIARVRLTFNWGFYLNKAVVSQLHGLKYVEVHFYVDSLTRGTNIARPPYELADFKKAGGIEWLKERGLKSIRFSMLIEGTQSTDDVKASILEWMKGGEEEILAVVPKQN
jgi:hypothetical protein